MFLKRIQDLQITHTRFNCQLVRCVFSRTEGQKITKLYSEICEDIEYVLKCGRPKRNGLVESKEIKILESALAANAGQFIVKIIASIENIFANNCGLVMEKAECDLQYYLDHLAEPTNQREDFFKRFEAFFTNVLNFLKSESVVYCDWKFENILVFNKCLAAPDSIKLCDFGSIQHAGTEIKNPKNFNVMFTSPYLSKDVITPCFKDDWISACFMFYKLNGQILPWEITTAGQNKALVYDQVLFLKISDTSSIDLNKCIYWPRTNHFFNLSEYL